MLVPAFENVLARDEVWGSLQWFWMTSRKWDSRRRVLRLAAVLSEFVGGWLLMLGLITRPAAPFIGITTFVAAFIFHKQPLQRGIRRSSLFSGRCRF